ncbi:MAG TPA: exosortase family protein XrtF [Aequorivita sp.]|nr:exosortase family protein XrtF [Aequorivita sp.]
MKKLFIKYKLVLRFVGLFLGTYLFLSFLYSIYLKFSFQLGYFPDFVSELVARQSRAVLEGFGYQAVLNPVKLEQSLYLTIDNKYSVSIVEGCNSVSVIILFVSFIIAFAEGFKKTFLFLLAGAVLIYVVNILRIAILTVALYKFPQYENLLHGIVFPGIIYTMVFILWMVWVRMLKTNSSR